MERSQLNIIAAALAALAVMGLIGVGVATLTYDAPDSESEYNENVFGAGLPPPTGGLYIVHESYGGAPSTGEAARRSDLIARAAATRQLDSFWGTSDGKRPNVSERQLLLNPNYNIFTPYEFQIKAVFKGEAQGNEMITLNRVGGRVGEDIAAVEYDAFAFTPGTDMILFLRDCGQDRVKRFGNDPAERFRIMDRYRLDKNGEPVDPDHLTYSELTDIIEREGSLEAKGGIIPC